MKLSYPYKVWLSTILASPFILIASWGIYNSSSFSEFIESYPLILMMILFGLGLSLPALWLYNLLFKELIDNKIKVELKKMILAFVGNSFIWITFYLFDRDFFKNADFYSLTWPGVYSIVMLASTFIFKMKSATNPENKKVEQPQSYR